MCSNFKLQLFSSLPNFVAGGRPSEDTLKHYTEEIDNYLNWCKDNGYNEFEDVKELEAFQYLHYLTNIKNYSAASICLKISAAKTFYFVAKKFGMIGINPFEDVKPKPPVYDDAEFDFFTLADLQTICENIKARTDETAKRDLAIVMLMAVEGCRTVEIYRMNDTDINFERNAILIHGKGKDGYIYPCADTMDCLKDYIAHRPEPANDEQGTPTFIGYSKKFFGARISRNGIRWAVNHILLAVDKKKKGSCCHTLRHSCGTNLYQETRDLRLVQETLRHTDVTTSSRYAHVVDRLEDRKTAKISPLNK